MATLSAQRAPAPAQRSWLLLFPILLLTLGVVSLALIRQQPLEWQTLGGAALFAVALVGRGVGALAPATGRPAAAAARSHPGRARPAHDLAPRTDARPAPGPVGPHRPGRAGRGDAPAVRSLAAPLPLHVGHRRRLPCCAHAPLRRRPQRQRRRLWFILGPLSIQPTEAVKLLLVVFLAAYLEDYRELLAFAGRRIGPISPAAVAVPGAHPADGRRDPAAARRAARPRTRAAAVDRAADHAVRRQRSRELRRCLVLRYCCWAASPPTDCSTTCTRGS